MHNKTLDRNIIAQPRIVGAGSLVIKLPKVIAEKYNINVSTAFLLKPTDDGIFFQILDTNKKTVSGKDRLGSSLPDLSCRR
jgi:hypothetical protein